MFATIKTTTCLVACSVLLGWAAAAEPVCIGTESKILVDDELIASRSGVVRRTHPCRKFDEPILLPETPWELAAQSSEGKDIDQRLYLYGTVLRDAATGDLRMWYNRLAYVLYATSKDGIHWQRPDLGLHAFQGSMHNNILNVFMHSPSIVRDEKAANPAERYRMLGSKKGYSTAHSPDGLRWTMYPNNPVIPGGDTCTLAQDPKTGEFLAFHKRTHQHRGHGRRLVYLATSRDMQHWSEPELVMAPDEIDDARTQSEGGLWSQFYNMSAFPYGGQWLGLATHFRYTGRPAKMQGPSQSADDGPIDVQLVHSRDGRVWHRCDDRSPVIPNGPHAYDAGCILGVANGPVVVDGELWIYYTAITTPHGGALPEKKISIAAGRWRIDGFVSLDAGSEGGTVETVPFDSTGSTLSINAEAARGGVRVEVLDVEGRTLPGYSSEECAELHGDEVCQIVRWTNRDALPHDRPIRLRFHLRDASLYSFQVR